MLLVYPERGIFLNEYIFASIKIFPLDVKGFKLKNLLI